MSSAFWKHLKPSVRAPAATAVKLESDGAELSLDWEDGAHSTVAARTLRQNCPCAECVEEWSGRRTFEPAVIPEGMKILSVEQVGNYALSFRFADAHSTGIFQWTTLRELSK
jgi:DUF971 family protein